MKRERDLEQELVRAVRKAGGEALKWTSVSACGVPDRIVILPGGRIRFVELKTDRGKLSLMQEYWQMRLSELGCSVRVIRGEEQLQEFIEEVRDEFSTSCIPDQGN